MGSTAFSRDEQPEIPVPERADNEPRETPVSDPATEVQSEPKGESNG
jgi:hypothetical protein